MKNSKYIKILTLTILIISVSFMVVGWYNSGSILSFDEYLKRNSSEVSFSEKATKEDFKISSKDLKKNEVFLAGESHGIAANYDLKLALIKYLNKYAGVKYLLEEISYSSAMYMQLYLETGNEGNLKYFFDDTEGYFAWNKEHYEFWKKLREYNQTLPDNKKIRVIGIDMSNQLKEETNYLYSCLPDKSIPIDIKPIVERFKEIKENYEKLDESIIKLTIKELNNDFENNTDIYKQYLGDKFFDFTIVLNTVFNLSNTTKETYSEIREECIYSNFKIVYNHFQKGNYFGQWGSEHVYQNNRKSYIYPKDRFAMCLNREESPVKDRVLSIRYLYRECYRMAPEKDYKEVKAYPDVYDIYTLDKFAETDITLFNLKNKRTPFSEELHFVAKPTDGATLDYFQYIILIKNSKGTIPLSN